MDGRLQSVRAAAAVVLVVVALAIVQQLPTAQTSLRVTFTDISPRFSPRYAAEYGTGSWGQYAAGGRVNNLAGVPGSRQIFYAATEWGGLWKTTDGGDTWFHLTRHVPTAVWDVAVDPLRPNTVYATSFYDGRHDPVSGIQVSYDGGSTWTHPPTATTSGLNCTDPEGKAQTAASEWSAFGIGIRPDAPNHVFIGTSCGLAISHDAGHTWAFVDPDPRPTRADPRFTSAGLSYVWDVVVQAGGQHGKGIIDVCGVQGHSRSTDGGETWTPHDLPYPTYSTGRCSIAASPDEPYVIFVVDDRTFGSDPILHMLYESDDAGRTWFRLGNPYRATEGDPPVNRGTKRLTFVVTNKRSDLGSKRRFDVWYGENEIWRVPCETPPFPRFASDGTTNVTTRCPPAQFVDGTLRWNGPPQWLDPSSAKKAGDPTVIEMLGAHGDSGDLEFDRTSAEDACPMLYASDGGVYINRTAPGEDCQSPRTFQQPSRGPRALWLWGMAGSNLPGSVVALHFGVQDDGSWAAPDAHQTPTWKDGPTSDSFSRVSDERRVVWMDQGGLKTAYRGTVDGAHVPHPGFPNERPLIGWFSFDPAIGQFTDATGTKEYIVLTSAVDLDNDGDTDGPDERPAVFVSENFGSSALSWRSLGAPDAPKPPCAVQTSRDPVSGALVIYVQTGGRCYEFASQGRLHKFIGQNSFVPWVDVDPDGELEGIDFFAVDPSNANRLYVSEICGPSCGRMRFSSDGGKTWNQDAKLDDMMTGKGLVEPGQRTFKFVSRAMCVNPFTATFSKLAQPSLLAFDPYDSDIIVAGGQDSGIFLTTDGGQNWDLLTNPINPNPLGRPHIPRPYFAHFDHDQDGIVWIYIGTQGRGVWRLRVELPVRGSGLLR